jgi:hypothetical protein
MRRCVRVGGWVGGWVGGGWREGSRAWRVRACRLESGWQGRAGRVGRAAPGVPTALAPCAQAVLYFRRALKLDRNYLAAWTLMGHEYVELKNPPAAIGGQAHALLAGIKSYLCPVQLV